MDRPSRAEFRGPNTRATLDNDRNGCAGLASLAQDQQSKRNRNEPPMAWETLDHPPRPLQADLSQFYSWEMKKYERRTSTTPTHGQIITLPDFYRNASTDRRFSQDPADTTAPQISGLSGQPRRASSNPYSPWMASSNIHHETLLSTTATRKISPQYERRIQDKENFKISLDGVSDERKNQSILELSTMPNYRVESDDQFIFFINTENEEVETEDDGTFAFYTAKKLLRKRAAAVVSMQDLFLPSPGVLESSGVSDAGDLEHHNRSPTLLPTKPVENIEITLDLTRHTKVLMKDSWYELMDRAPNDMSGADEIKKLDDEETDDAELFKKLCERNPMVAAVLMDGALQVQKSDQVAATSTVQVVRAQESDRTPTMHIHKMESDQTMILDEPLSSTTKFDKRGNFDEMRRALDAVEQGIVEKQKDYGPKRTKTEVQESGTRMIEVTNEAEKGPEKSMSVNHDTLIREIVACGNVFISLLNGGVTAKLEDGDVAIEAWEQLIGDIPVQHRLMKLWLRGLLQELEDRTECALPSENLQRVVNVFRDRSIARKAHFARLIGINEAIITDAIKSNHMSSLEEEDFAVGCVIIALELMLPPRLTKTRIEMSLSEDTFNGQLVNRMKAKDLRQWRKLFVSIPSPRFIGLESVIKGVLIILLDMKPGEAGGSTLPSELLATSVSYLESVAIE